MAYEILGKPRPFPGQRRDGTLGTRYEVSFANDLVERDSVIVDDLDSKLIDKLIKEKIEQHRAVLALGKT